MLLVVGNFLVVVWFCLEIGGLDRHILSARQRSINICELVLVSKLDLVWLLAGVLVVMCRTNDVCDVFLLFSSFLCLASISSLHCVHRVDGDG